MTGERTAYRKCQWGARVTRLAHLRRDGHEEVERALGVHRAQRLHGRPQRRAHTLKAAHRAGRPGAVPIPRCGEERRTVSSHQHLISGRAGNVGCAFVQNNTGQKIVAANIRYLLYSFLLVISLLFLLPAPGNARAGSSAPVAGSVSLRALALCPGSVDMTHIRT